MSIREDLERYSGESAEQKLLILRRELMTPILTVQASARLFNEYRQGLTEVLPADINAEELNHMIDWLYAASQDLEEILNTLTSDGDEVPPHHRGN